MNKNIKEKARREKKEECKNTTYKKNRRDDNNWSALKIMKILKTHLTFRNLKDTFVFYFTSPVNQERFIRRHLNNTNGEFQKTISYLFLKINITLMLHKL